MAHLLPLWVVEAAANLLAVHCIMDREVAVLGKVDFMVEKGGLRRRSGHYGDLSSVSNVCTAAWESRQTHSLVVEEEDLHLGRGGACRSAVPDRHHLGDVAGDGLYDIHGRREISRSLLRARGRELRGSLSHSLFHVDAVVRWSRQARNVAQARELRNMTAPRRIHPRHLGAYTSTFQLHGIKYLSMIYHCILPFSDVVGRVITHNGQTCGVPPRGRCGQYLASFTPTYLGRYFIDD